MAEPLFGVGQSPRVIRRGEVGAFGQRTGGDAQRQWQVAAQPGDLVRVIANASGDVEQQLDCIRAWQRVQASDAKTAAITSVETHLFIGCSDC
ncbi:MAG: hypothetical protein ACREAM_26565 [Blastocatellia bacterium]